MKRKLVNFLESLLGFPVDQNTNKAKVLGAIQRNQLKVKHFKFEGKDMRRGKWR